MDNPEEVLHILDEFAKLKPKDIPKELEDYLSYVARTGDPVYQWSLVKCLFREKLLRVITDFYESSTLINPPSPAVDNFNYEAMKGLLLEKLETFSNAPFTVQRLCELLTAPRKQYNRTDKFMRAIEKNILVVSTREPGNACRQDNALSEPLPNGVTDGESLAQAVKNETAHLAEAQLTENEETSLSEDGHVDIGSVEYQNSLATVAPKDLEGVSVEPSNNSEGPSGNKLTTDSTVNLDDSDCKASVNIETPVVSQNELIENSEPSVKSDSGLHTVECVGSTEEPLAPVQTVQPVEDQVELSGQPVVYDVVSIEPEQIESVKEVAVSNADEVVCASKSDEVRAELSKDEDCEAILKPLADESDVSCSSSDTTNLSNTPPEEQDGVSTSETVPVASSSEVIEGAAPYVEAVVDATSSEDLKEVLPEPSESSEVVTENPKETEILKDVGSSSDSLISTENETKEENGVGTTEKVDVEEPSAEVSEESQSQSPVVGESVKHEESSGLTPEEEKPIVEESSVSEASVSESSVVEENIEVPIGSPGIQIKESKSSDVSSASETCSKNESKKAQSSVPEEAMDVDEANSCHSTGAGTETEEMTVADQIEPMDDSE